LRVKVNRVIYKLNIRNSLKAGTEKPSHESPLHGAAAHEFQYQRQLPALNKLSDLIKLYHGIVLTPSDSVGL
tara:strand:- start:2595 stop:2810 length:216 start_codon:yes stop_codon:yes gene_type:complete